MRWPEDVRGVVHDLRNRLGSEQAVVRTLALLGARTLAGSLGALPPTPAASPRSRRDGPTPAVKDVLQERLGEAGLSLKDFRVGRPTTALVCAIDTDRCGGEPSVAPALRIDRDGVDAYVCSVRRRSRAGQAMFGVTLPRIDSSTEFETRRTELFLFVLCEQGRVWAINRGELDHIVGELRGGTRVPRFLLIGDRVLRLTLSGASSGLDLTERTTDAEGTT